MKKLFLLMLNFIIIFTFISCDKQGEDNKEEIYDYSYFVTDKLNYKIGEKIKVTLYNTDENDFLAITEYGKDVTNQYVLSKRQIKDVYEQTFNIEKLNGAGDYTIFLYDNGYEVMYSLDIHLDDEDDNDYQISSATLIVSDDKQSSKININTTNKNELTYRLYLAKDNVRLKDYMALKTYISKDKNSFDIELPNNLFIPNEANQIEVSIVEGVTTSYFINIDDSLKLETSKHIFTFNALSDIHIQSRNASSIFNSHLRLTLRDIYKSSSEAIFINGDVINMSEESNYVFYKSILEEEKTDKLVPIYYALGNHEYMYQQYMNVAVDLFNSQFGYEKHYYSLILKGYKFIILGSEDISPLGKMGNEEINWLKEELATTNNIPTFIFLHQPLKDTVSGSLETMYGQSDYGFGSVNQKLREILKNYPNAIMFSAHSHYTLEEYQSVLYGNMVDASFVNCGAISYLNANGLEDIGGAEGYYIEVYEDYILLRGKEFVYNKWISSAQFMFTIVK